MALYAENFGINEMELYFNSLWFGEFYQNGCHLAKKYKNKKGKKA